MRINISQAPPTDVVEGKKIYLRIIPILLALILGAILLALFLFAFGSSQETLLENIALALFVGPGLAFFFFAEKLHGYKALSAKQEKEMEEFRRQDPEIAAYCAKVSLLDRTLIKAEYDACKARAEKVKRP
ncbi:hypothetical protein [Thiovibrio frasassiensis]|uniref:Uncharacterized protein n=1 Tax=Thiovibrio frasassiensis TaxID=2984131 RepID=A0A9X4MCP6_9BACT|nr:hypothetical protein [Thiovibrio frasassiensis]MDG4475154.1 hypothetical protein [Thiovibrio frasassiensis]